MLLTATSALATSLVRLKNGTVFRGKVMTVSIESGVVIEDQSGTRITIPYQDVAYIGAENENASSTDTLPPIHKSGDPKLQHSDRVIQLSFTGKTPDLSLYQLAYRGRSGAVGLIGLRPAFFTVDSAGYSYICTGPCEFEMNPGSYRLAVGTGRRLPVEVRYPISLNHNGKLAATYDDNYSIRLSGLLIATCGSAVGLGLMTGGLLDDNNTGAYLISGATISTAALITGIIMALVRDKVSLSYSN
jgi:hypothetical protein